MLIKNLSFWYGDNKIIDNFSYKFEEWKIYGIFWRSWLWKSTLARVMSWFLQPSEWIVILNNKQIISPSKNIFYMNQKDDIFYRLTLYENLYILCHNEREIDNILQKVGLYDYKNKFPKELSWWMIKRLSFARILILKPRILVLDEPFVHLDTEAKWGLMCLLLDMQKINKNMTIVLISHNIKEMKIAKNILKFKNSINNKYNQFK